VLGRSEIVIRSDADEQGRAKIARAIGKHYTKPIAAPAPGEPRTRKNGKAATRRERGAYLLAHIRRSISQRKQFISNKENRQ
jgi:hypothetical protein